MSHPFEDPNSAYLVLINDEGQYSLWPVFAMVPSGWTVVREGAPREVCLAFVNEHWRDMRPQSVRRDLPQV